MSPFAPPLSGYVMLKKRTMIHKIFETNSAFMLYTIIQWKMWEIKLM